MLYDRWRRIAQEFQKEVALIDVASGQHWTFQELAQTADQESLGHSIAFPRGLTCQFIFTVLRAWRHGIAVCPLEEGQLEPSFAALPPGCVQLKSTSATMGQP